VGVSPGGAGRYGYFLGAAYPPYPPYELEGYPPSAKLVERAQTANTVNARKSLG